jgi:two-component system, NtrC family, sensor kinase
MAEELDGFYHELERKVAEKGRELVRSERLASVGYLAAGVAHEINNPLGIISGYAEYSLAELERGGNGASKHNGDSSSTPGLERTREDPGPVVTEVTKSLRIICDEAFRCKTITQKLLSLARGGDEARKPVSLLAVANEVASIVGGLHEHRDKRLIVRASEQPSEAAGDGMVVAVEAEMKQVLLNLTINALEAVDPDRGEVRIELRRSGQQVELSVTDNGRGMTPATLERAFEPFFTEKRGVQEDGRRGTGLGLSITHAIVQDHGGTITAHSEGPGRGSRFIVRLPAAA